MGVNMKKRRSLLEIFKRSSENGTPKITEASMPESNLPNDKKNDEKSLKSGFAESVLYVHRKRLGRR